MSFFFLFSFWWWWSRRRRRRRRRHLAEESPLHLLTSSYNHKHSNNFAAPYCGGKRDLNPSSSTSFFFPPSPHGRYFPIFQRDGSYRNNKDGSALPPPTPSPARPVDQAESPAGDLQHERSDPKVSYHTTQMLVLNLRFTGSWVFY